jgi:hypothetical protein
MRKILEKINILNLTVVLILSGLTIFKIGLLTKEISLIGSMKKEIIEISKENQKLEDEALAINSISNLDQFLENTNLVKAEKMKFIHIFGGGVVVK